MVIGKFNRYFQKHGRITFMFILAVIALSMVIYIGPQGCAGRGGLSVSGAIGSLNGVAFTYDDLNREMLAVNLSQNRLGERTSESELRQAWPQVFLRLRWLQEAKRLGLDQVTDDELAAKIKGESYLQDKTGYSPELFANLKAALQRNHYTVDQWLETVREELVLQRVFNLFRYGATSTAQEAKVADEGARLQAEAEVARYYSFQYLPSIVPTDAELKAEYDQHAKDYTVKQQRAALVALFPVPSASGPAPTDAQVADYYKKHLGTEFTRQFVHAREIYLTLADDADKAARDAAHDKLAGLLKQVKGGADFAQLALKHNEDPTAKDGDLGFFTREQRPDADAVFSIKDKECTAILDAPGGLRILQRLGAREEAQPLDSVRAQIVNKLQSAAADVVYEQQARKQYEQDLEKKYRQHEVHARHILLRFFPTDDEKVKADKRKQLDGIRQQVLKGGDFAALAKEFSQDPGSADKGGDLGFFAKGTMVKEFDNAAWALKPGDLSEVFQTSYGVHLMQKLEERDVTPFSAVRDDLISQLREDDDNKRREAVLKVASEFSDKLHDAVGKISGDALKAEFTARVAALGATAKLVDTGLVPADARMVANVPASPQALLRALFSRTLVDPLNEPVDLREVIAVPLLTNIVEAHVPKFEDAKESVRSHLRMSRALQAAQKEATEKGAALQAALKAGKTFAEAKGDIPFTPSGPVSLSGNSRQSDPGQAQLRELLSRTPAGTLVPAVNTESGAMIVYVLKHSLAPSTTPDGDDDFASMYRNRATTSMLEGYDAHLSKKADLQLAPEWQFLVKADTDPAAPPAE